MDTTSPSGWKLDEKRIRDSLSLGGTDDDDDSTRSDLSVEGEGAIRFFFIQAPLLLLLLLLLHDKETQ